MVHDACTTSLEAKAYGLHVLSLRPAEVGDYYNSFANQFSDINFTDAKALYEYLRQKDGTDWHGASSEDACNSIAPNISGDMFADVMFQKIEKYNSLKSQVTLQSRTKIAKDTGRKYLSVMKAKAFRSFFQVTSGWSKHELLSRHSKAQKFPPILYEKDLLRKITTNLSPSISQDRKANFKRLSPKAFLITRSE